jgi:ABC-type nitrate/sulfonate/bicarbonate transport system substrate-binding protein
MTEALQEGDLDVALMLTEGFVSAFHRGLKAKIVKVYTKTPLTWGIYGGYADTPRITSNHNRKYAISRRGSGSHLMARIHAKQLGFHPSDDQYVEVANLKNAIQSLRNRESDYFYWEKYTSIPSVKKGHLCFLDTFHAPWCGFVAVANNNAIEQKSESIQKVLQLMNERCEAFMKDEENIFRVSNRFEISTAAATEWFNTTAYQDNFDIKKIELDAIHDALNLEAPSDYASLLGENITLV